MFWTRTTYVGAHFRRRYWNFSIPRALVPGVLPLVHGTYDHRGVARTLMLVKGKRRWPTVAQYVREYVLSCESGKRKEPGTNERS